MSGGIDVQGRIVFWGLAVLWLLASILFYRTKMKFFQFMVCTIGAFTIGMIFILPYFQGYVERAISETMDLIAVHTKFIRVSIASSIITVQTPTGIISILIDYECSGIIEMFVFTSLSLFFPFGSILRKCLLTAIGNGYIFAANILRILFIAAFTRSFGVSMFYLAHTLFARILFFAMMLLLYYVVFTASHLKYQKVGEI